MSEGKLRIMKIEDEKFIRLKMLSVSRKSTLGETVEMLLEYFEENKPLEVVENVKN